MNLKPIAHHNQILSGVRFRGRDDRRRREKYDGVVIWYNERRGYGFVRFDKDEIFLHHSALTRFGPETVYPDDQLSVYLAGNECGPEIQMR